MVLLTKKLPFKENRAKLITKQKPMSGFTLAGQEYSKSIFCHLPRKFIIDFKKDSGPYRKKKLQTACYISKNFQDRMKY